MITMVAPFLIWSYLTPWITSQLFPKEMIEIADPQFVAPTQEEYELSLDTEEPLSMEAPMIEVLEDGTWLETLVKIFLSCFFMVVMILLHLLVN